MDLKSVETYEELKKYLREYSTWVGHVYDPNGRIHLMLALLDNLQKNAVDVELEEIGYLMTDSQRTFLTKLAEYANQVTDADIE